MCVCVDINVCMYVHISMSISISIYTIESRFRYIHIVYWNIRGPLCMETRMLHFPHRGIVEELKWECFMLSMMGGGAFYCSVLKLACVRGHVMCQIRAICRSRSM